MNKEELKRIKENSLMELLDNCELYPFNKVDLLRIVDRYGVDIRFDSKYEIEMAIIFHNHHEYIFYKQGDGLYHLKEK